MEGLFGSFSFIGDLTVDFRLIEQVNKDPNKRT